MAIDKNTVSKEAQKFAAKGQFDKAIAEWKKLLKESPNDPNIFNTIGDLCLKKDSKADAVDAYRKAADLLAADGFTSKAIALYKKVLNIDPKQIEVHLSLGDLNAEKGLTGNALESYKIVADHYTHQKDPVKALGIYQKMADLNPANIAFRVKLGDMYAKENMASEASAAYLAAAEVHMSKSAFKDARQLFEKVLALDPGNKAVYYKAGMLYLQEGKFSEACKALKPAFESDPSSREVADTYLEALLKAGKEPEAVQVIGKILAADAARTDLREKLVKIHLGKKDDHKALTETALIAEAKTAEGDSNAAENILKAFVAEVPEYVPARQKLAEFYRSVGRNQDAAVTFLQAAEILTETNDQGGAKAFLNRALELAPDLPEAKKLLEQLEATTPVPAPPEPEVAEPAAAVQQPAAKPAVATLSILEENPAINEAFTEIDVLVKYGLAAKAIEQLEALATKYPESPQVHMRLQDLYRDQGNSANAVAHALALADLYASKNMKKQADSVLQSALSLDPNNNAVRAKLGMAPVVPSEAPLKQKEREKPFPPEVSLPKVSPAKMSPKPAVAPPAFEDPFVSDEAEPVDEIERADEISFEGLDAGIPSLEEELPTKTAARPEAPAREKAPAPAKKSRAGAAKAPEEPVKRISEPEVPVQKPAAAIQADINEIWAEAEFYFQQGLFDEAKKHYAKIVELNPSNRRAIDRLGEISQEEEKTLEFTKLAEAVEELEDSVVPEAAEHELPFSASDEDAVRGLMQEISQLGKPQSPAASLPPDEETPTFSPQPAAAELKKGPSSFLPEVAAAPAPSGLPVPEEDFFDLGEELKEENSSAAARKVERSSDDFFDLAAELRDELNTVAVPERPAGPADEQSLDEIFEDFKRGVEKQSVKEDVDTHYNLGVAYKEMGLLDDAIAEFILTPEDEPRFIQSRYLLGLCYMEKGEYQNATREIQHALHCSESLLQEDEDTLGMHYDLGLAYQGAGNINNAISEFQIVAALDPQYRDTTSKLKELQQGDFISLDQLKDDIEKEISSKFFEEGERIEREEKNRKSERVRN
jgi:tetratricopeptide (TPR) repeat protein